MNTMLSRRLAAAALLSLLAAATPLWAASYCVGTTAELRDALDDAAASSEDDVIRLETGDYPLADSGLFIDAIRGSLVLRGGYGNGCPLLGRSLDPADTRLYSVTPQARGISLYISGSNLEIDGLRFEDLLSVTLYAIGGVQVTTASGLVRVHRSQFAGNRRGLHVFSSQKDVRIENSVFLDNASLGFSGEDDGVAIKVSHLAEAQAAISVDVLFNTVLGGPRGVWIAGGGPFDGAPRVQNNILRPVLEGTGPYALRIDAAQVAATNNIWGPIVTNNGGELGTNLLNVDEEPELDSGLVPVAGSPALNSGTDFVAGGTPATDHDGGPRIVGSLPERGALESAISDIDTIVVTSTASSGAGTLRQAILDSNLTVNAERIEFDLGAAGGCPYSISVGSLLPVVTSPLTIDGFTQPGSSPNTRSDSYDGVHCVVLTGSATKGLRLQPPVDQAITVTGIAFQRFSEAAIEVDGPGGARIRGNTFGVVTNPLVPPGFLGDAVSIIGSHRSQVGGTDEAHANLIGNADGAGLRLTDCSDCSVRNNFIGVRADGYSDLGNGVGVLAQGGDGSIAFNVIGHSATQGVRIQGETASYTVLANDIGQSPVLVDGFDIPYEISNGTNGIRLVGGSSHYVSSNTIAHNGTDGLVVLDAVDDAHIRQNKIFGNGQLGIDLSPDGVDPQDSDLSDAGGGNGGQNFPVLLEAIGSDSEGTVSGELFSRTGEFEIELYANQACDASGHGEGQRWIGKTTVAITLAVGPGLPIEATVPFSVDVTSAVGPGAGLLGRFITATATRLSLDEGASSEFSACIEYLQGPQLFRDGFED